jgi:IS1 family transposase
MNRLSTEKRAEILGMMVEGNSLRATSRMAGVSINTVSKLLVDVGAACTAYQDEVLRDLPCTTIQADEIWSFVYAKAARVPEKHRDDPGYGDVWTWVALCADTKLAVSWLVGERNGWDCWNFIQDLQQRVRGRIQLSTDGFVAYRGVVGLIFKGDVDWAQIVKHYRSERISEARYSPPACTGTTITKRLGNPDPAKVSTSYVERQNLTMRMSMRRFTRLTNAFSKKVENHAAAVALHFLNYNFVRPHTSLAQASPHGPKIKRTPAMAAGVADHIWTLEEVARLTEGGPDSN